MGVVLNASNEVAVGKFLSGQIGFLDVSEITMKALEKFNNIKINSIDDIFQIDKEVRNYCGA